MYCLLLLLFSLVMITSNAYSSEGGAIFEAVEMGDTARVKALLEKDPALVKARQFMPDGETPLHMSQCEVGKSRNHLCSRKFHQSK
jgi:hypothetical protein